MLEIFPKREYKLLVIVWFAFDVTCEDSIKDFSKEEQKQEFLKLVRKTPDVLDRCKDKFKDKFYEDNIIELVKIPPPPLHTFRLGPVNHLLDHLGNLYPELEQHLADLHVVKENYHGKTFEGWG